jgi:hypothetical protein
MTDALLSFFPYVPEMHRVFISSMGTGQHRSIILVCFGKRSPCSQWNVSVNVNAPRDDFLTILTCSDYSKLPPSPPVDFVFLLDPLIATGGTACAALTMIVDWGIPGEHVLPVTSPQIVEVVTSREQHQIACGPCLGTGIGLRENPVSWHRGVLNICQHAAPILNRCVDLGGGSGPQAYPWRSHLSRIG